MAESSSKSRRARPAAAPDAGSGVTEAAESITFGEAQRQRAADLEAPSPDADLYERIAWIFSHVPDVPKLGHAEVKDRDGKRLYTYDYVKEPDMMNAIRPLLGRAGVAAFPSLGKSQTDSNKTTIEMLLKFCYKDQSETIRVEASGTDKGEKATIKAVTTGMRYLLQKQFMIATDGLDPEQENQEYEPSGQAPQRRAAPRPASPRRASGKPTDAISPNARGTIFQHARSLFIAEERVRPILQYASDGQITSTSQIMTNAQLDWAYKQLDRYAADPEAGDTAIAAAGIDVTDRTKIKDDPEPRTMDLGGGEVELTPEEMEAMNAPDDQPEYEE